MNLSMPLLVLTALGAVTVYLMLPRAKPSLVKVGGLLGALTLAGLFAYLASLFAHNNTEVSLPVYFYLFAGIAIASAIGVICHPKPVYSALYFVLLSLAGAGLYVLLLAEFVAVVLIIIYAGAILVTYVFVIMLASQEVGGRRAAEYDRFAADPLPAVFVGFLLIGTVLLATFPKPGESLVQVNNPDTKMVAYLENKYAAAGELMPAPQSGVLPTLPTAGMAQATTATANTVPGNIQVLGNSLYGKYLFSVELAGILLTISLVGAVMIARKRTAGVSVDSERTAPLNQ
ncbi:MAG: NADH-quinone oxidoreductase subunit J [Phycisphaerae bacterium]